MACPIKALGVGGGGGGGGGGCVQICPHVHCAAKVEVNWFQILILLIPFLFIGNEGRMDLMKSQK
jgi:hypothetical protein